MTKMAIECDTTALLAQIGMWNVLAVSGGRVMRRETGVTLPVARGYSVTVDLMGDDTYTVRRMFKRSGVDKVMKEWDSVYCDQVGETTYRASCYLDK
jgi:hypothetical protein